MSDYNLRVEMSSVNQWFCSDFIKTLAKDMYIEIIRRREENRVMREAIQNALNNLGVPQPDYPAPVAHAHQILTEALSKLEKK